MLTSGGQLKALPEELLRGPNQLLEEIETDESIVASCTQDIGSGRARHRTFHRNSINFVDLKNWTDLTFIQGNRRSRKATDAQRKNAGVRQSTKDATSGKMEEFRNQNFEPVSSLCKAGIKIVSANAFLGQLRFWMDTFWIAWWNRLENLIPKHMWKSKIRPLELK